MRTHTSPCLQQWPAQGASQLPVPEGHEFLPPQEDQVGTSFQQTWLRGWHLHQVGFWRAHTSHSLQYTPGHWPSQLSVPQGQNWLPPQVLQESTVVGPAQRAAARSDGGVSRRAGLCCGACFGATSPKAPAAGQIWQQSFQQLTLGAGTQRRQQQQQHRRREVEAAARGNTQRLVSRARFRCVAAVPEHDPRGIAAGGRPPAQHRSWFDGGWSLGGVRRGSS